MAVTAAGKLTQILTVLVSLGLSYTLSLGDSDNCQLLPTRVPITRYRSEERDGRRISVICEGNVNLTKCEGVCDSRVAPSVTDHRGYRKDCRCCVATTSQTKSVTLQCYTVEDNSISSELSVNVPEVTGCSCELCTG